MGRQSVHPHGRGDNAKKYQTGGRRRFTPTGVGTTRARSAFRTTARGSPPRAWGQLEVSPRTVDDAAGSPPRAWGQRAMRSCLTQQETVHPHGRGDNHLSLAGRAYRLRFTPTGVGTTEPRGTSGHIPLRFTPTGVGTTSGSKRTTAEDTGSPPRAWGQRIMPHHPRSISRFTPTGVGTTVGRLWGSPLVSRFTPTGVGTTPAR